MNLLICQVLFLIPALFATALSFPLFPLLPDHFPGFPVEVPDTREFGTLKSKKVPQSLETGLFFCQLFRFII